LPALGKNTAPYLVSWILPVLCKNSGAAESPESVKAVTLNLENCSCSQATCLHRHNKILKQKEASITNEIRHIFIYWLIDKKKDIRLGTNPGIRNIDLLVLQIN
jgi:hypothetical protein